MLSVELLSKGSVNIKADLQEISRNDEEKTKQAERELLAMLENEEKNIKAKPKAKKSK
jgi:hypothetical protein